MNVTTASLPLPLISSLCIPTPIPIHHSHSLYKAKAATTSAPTPTSPDTVPLDAEPANGIGLVAAGLAPVIAPVPVGAGAAGAPVGKGAVTPGSAELCAATELPAPGIKFGLTCAGVEAPAIAAAEVVVNCTAGTVTAEEPTVMVLAGWPEGTGATEIVLGTAVTMPGFAET